MVCTVVVVVVVPGTDAAAVVVAVVVVTTVEVWTRVVVTVTGGVVVVTAVVVGTRDVVAVVDGVVPVMGAVVVAAAEVVALVVVWFASDEIAVETASRCVPLPQDVTATAKAIRDRGCEIPHAATVGVARSGFIIRSG